MLIAMAIAAALCIAIGTLPSLFYQLLPYTAAYEPYTASHVVDQMQLLVFSALAFAVLMRTGIYPPELRSVNIDFDWSYRRLAPTISAAVARVISATLTTLGTWGNLGGRRFMARLYRYPGPEGILARTWPTGSMALWVMLMLLAYLVLYYI